MTDMKPIFVTGATGTQGGAVARMLLRAGWPVRVLVRDPAAPGTRALIEAGAVAVRGDLNDEAVLARGVVGAHGVFSVPIVGFDDDPELEMRAGRRLIGAAKAAGVTIFVHSSVARAGDHEGFVEWETGRWWPRYWRDKAAYNRMVREAGFAHQVVLKPAFMMENFLPPKTHYMMPHLAEGRLLTSMAPEALLDVIAADDIARFARAAFEDPARFDGEVIELAATRTTMGRLAQVISGATGKSVAAVHVSPDEALRLGLMQMVVDNHQWNNVEGYKVDLERVATWGIPITSLEDWARDHKEQFDVG